MFYGMISSEALKNPLILNDFVPIKVVVDYKPSSGMPYWHRYLLKIEDREIDSITRLLAPLINAEWYAVFWNDKIVYVLFKDKVFTLKKEENWQSGEYLNMKKYGISHGVEEEYLDFNERFKHYKELLEKYNN